MSNAPEPGMNGTMYQAAMAAKRKREIAGMEAEIARLREELAPLRELVGVDGRASSALSDIQHWQKMMDKADERDAATARADDLQSAWDEVLGSHRVNGPSYREAAQALIARVDAAERELKDRITIQERQIFDWAEDDTEIKLIAESVGIQGESKDDYFRSAVDVVQDMANALLESQASERALRDVCQSIMEQMAFGQRYTLKHSDVDALREALATPSGEHLRQHDLALAERACAKVKGYFNGAVELGEMGRDDADYTLGIAEDAIRASLGKEGA